MTGILIFLVCSVVVAILAVRMADRINQPTATTAAPQAQWGHWHVTYQDVRGNITKRTIRILEVKPNLRRIEVWCEATEGNRTFYLDQILEASDVATSRAIDKEAWLKSYRKARRQS